MFEGYGVELHLIAGVEEGGGLGGEEGNRGAADEVPAAGGGGGVDAALVVGDGDGALGDAGAWGGQPRRDEGEGEAC